MKKLIEILTAGVIAGACAMQMINKALESLMEKPFTFGGEFILPILIVLTGYLGWRLAESYFNETKYKEVYNKGFKDGTKLHSYRIIIPLEEELKEDADKTA